MLYQIILNAHRNGTIIGMTCVKLAGFVHLNARARTHIDSQPLKETERGEKERGREGREREREREGGREIFFLFSHTCNLKTYISAATLTGDWR